MKNTIHLKKLPARTAALFAAACLLTGCGSAVDKDKLKAEIESANAEWMQAVKNGDAAAVAAVYAEDAMLLPPNVPAIQGREGIEGFFSTAMRAGIQQAKLVTEEVDGNGESAIEKGSYTMMVDGDIVVDKGKYLVHWKNIDGKWRFYRDMFNSDMPAAAPAPALQKGNVVGLHLATIKLKPGVSEEQFAAFYREKVIPEFEKVYPDTKLYLIRGLRGENANRLGLIYFFGSDETRNKYFKPDGTPTETGLLLQEKMKPAYDQLSQVRVSADTKYTDWLIE